MTISVMKAIKSFFGPKEERVHGLTLGEWMERLQFGSLKAREAAVEVVPQFGKKAISPLLRALRLRDKTARHAVVRALGNIGPDAAKVLMELLASPGDEATEAGGIIETVAVSKVTTVNGKHIIPTDLDWTVRVRCAESLGSLGKDAEFALPLLKAIVKNPHEPREVQAAAAEAVYNIDPDAIVNY